MTALSTKPNATTAAMTAFCAAKIEGRDGFLWIDGNGKITAANGTLANPKPNAFSLVQIADCPGATKTCSSLCYVHGLEKYAPETHALYRHNSEQIRKIVSGKTWEEWARVVGGWIAENCKGGFRWHVSGDVFSLGYAQFIRSVCEYSPDVPHWIYIRSFFALDHLSHIDNLTVNISADKDNYEAAKVAASAYGLRICYVSDNGFVPDDLPEGSVIFPDYSLRGGTDLGMEWFSNLSKQYKAFVCPVDFHGKAENRRCGPCDRCMKPN